MEPTSGTDLALRMPSTAARLVVNPDADTRNAWEVLVSAFGSIQARDLVTALPGGAEALTRIGA